MSEARADRGTEWSQKPEAHLKSLRGADGQGVGNQQGHVLLLHDVNAGDWNDDLQENRGGQAGVPLLQDKRAPGLPSVPFPPPLNNGPVQWPAGTGAAAGLPWFP